MNRNSPAYLRRNALKSVPAMYCVKKKKYAEMGLKLYEQKEKTFFGKQTQEIKKVCQQYLPKTGSGFNALPQ